MDDFNLSCLSEAKNEYSARLVNILTPYISEGIQSIFREALELCDQNDEMSKYLITFQNFLARIPKWNQTIIDEESNRILERSGCNYLEDLITCVHITQLKILTSIRVGTKQKKIELDIPRLADFIHKVYIEVARKLYKNIYLFERGIPALDRQRHQRIFETIIRESILNSIRDSIPTDKILRAYMDQSSEIEEEVEERIVEEPKLPNAEKPTDISKNKITTDVSNTDISNTDVSNTDVSNTDVPEFKNTITVKKESWEKRENGEKRENREKRENGEEKTDISNSLVSLENKSSKAQEIHVDTSQETNKDTSIASNTEHTESKLTPNEHQHKKADKIPREQTLQFNDTDNILNMDTNKEEKVNVPKTVENLEEISKQRELERNEEEDDEQLRILDDANTDDIKLDIEDLQDGNTEKDRQTPIDLGIEDIPTF